jgi:hypothetical protein
LSGLRSHLLDVAVLSQGKELVAVQVHRPPVLLVEVPEEVPEYEVLHSGGGVKRRSRQCVT